MSTYRLLGFFPVALLPLTALLMGFSKGPLPQLTGGFQEGTCISCHDSFSLNEGRTKGGIFHVAGVPRHYSAGVVYPLTVVIAQPGQSRWGFELSARFTASGNQAGRLEPVDELTQMKEKNGIQYIEHTAMGNRGGVVDGPVEFRFNWVAPDPSGGPVFFNAAGNGANSSGDPSGDYIYTAGAYSGVPGVTFAGAVAGAPPRRQSRGASLSNRLVNLPTTRPVERGTVEFFIGHRFTQPLFQHSIADAFGLDSSANISFGVTYGLARNVGVSFHRTRAWAAMDLAGEFSLLQQEAGAVPVSLLVKTGVAGRDNFGLSPSELRNLRNKYHYSPYVQVSTSRSFEDRFTLFVVPSAIFNSRDEMELLFGPGFGKENNHTFALGVGGSLKLTPSTFLVAEYIPRLAGFRGVYTDRPAVSVGLQKNTSGHAFQLLLSTAPGLAPNEFSLEGTDTFRIGFNIYRRIQR